MFDVSGTDIQNLDDTDLRTLVARLALAEIRRQGASLSAVTAGGSQDAADGGLDVRVESPIVATRGDFVPRAMTGFQVKKPDMPANAIASEMRPKGVIRPAIVDLAAASGAYIIVSAQGSVADKPLSERRKAMRDALHDLPTASNLHTDFYDRERLATWVNEYPGIAAWVKKRIGHGTTGWSSVGNWTGTDVSERSPFLFNDKACLVDERSCERETLTVGEGIARLRSVLRTPKQCIRLIGLSGLGKTRLVQALFESGVGDEPLDPAIAIYTDYSSETDPSARDMARQLVATGQRAVLVIDNCNPAVHSELARICSESPSNVSLLTVEYDVRDDEPERTEVFRLQSAAPELVATWLEGQFPDVSRIDRDQIAEFSDGNFRVARAVAETLGRGETLGKLKSRDLFERIFHQRNQPDRTLLSAAEDLALLYSIDGEDASPAGELARIASVRSVNAHELYAALVELCRRGVCQTRGRWRAILPHAIANALASYALERIPEEDFDRFASSLTPRMLKSLSRRVSYLHDVKHAQSAVTRWLRQDGPLGDLFALEETGVQIITNIAPVAPDVVLTRIERELNGPDGNAVLAPRSRVRSQWIRLIKKLAYEAHMFDRAVILLARFVAAEPPDYNNHSARGPFGELFQLHLSGTLAGPEQRRSVIERLARSGDTDLHRAALLGLDSLLVARQFTTTSDFDFGARSRNWGWHPKINRDVWDWYDRAIDMAVEISTIHDEARATLARHIRELWSYGACHEALDQAATAFAKQKPWIEGWLAFRAALKYDSGGMGANMKAKLEQIIQRLKPSDLLHQARAIVLSRGGAWDIEDCESDDGDAMQSWHRAAQLAQEVGRSLAQHSEIRKQFVSELLGERYAHRAFECGCGLAEGASDLMAMWRELADAYVAAELKGQCATLLGGFIHQANLRDPEIARSTLEAAIRDPQLSPTLPYLQARVGINDEGIARLRRAISFGALGAEHFCCIANGVVGDAPADPLGDLLLDIGRLPDGVEIALDILHMHFYCDREKGRRQNLKLVEVGRELLRRTDFKKKGALRDYGLDTVIRICCSGVEGQAVAQKVCENIRTEMDSVSLSSHDLNYVLKALFETQPSIALDIFLLASSDREDARIFDFDFEFGAPLEDMDPTILRRWADRDASLRYPLLGQSIPMFKATRGQENDEVSPMFLDILKSAPDKKAFLGSFWGHVHPRGWCGSLAAILTRRRAQLLRLQESQDPGILDWVAEVLPELDLWIERERVRERAGEQSFE